MAAKSLWSRLGWWLLKRERVGFDGLGNTYYRRMEKTIDGGLREVRYAQYAGSYDPEAVPPEWQQWLRRTRRAPPTEADLAQGSAERAQFQQRVQEVEREEARRRYQEQAGGGGGPQVRQPLGGGGDG